MANSDRGHQARKHSKFSASGAERWFNCQGSVALSEGLPDKGNKWSKEGTTAHEVLENVMRSRLANRRPILIGEEITPEMKRHAQNTADFIFEIFEGSRAVDAEILVETRISLPFIHPEMFGTFDGAVLDHFGTLHVFDYKYGKSVVSPLRNLQMIFYALGLGHQYFWNFKSVKMWIAQPRIKNYEGPVFWELPMPKLMRYVPIFQDAVEKVELEPNRFVEGSWCHWCKAKDICPLKKGERSEKINSIFGAPLETEEEEYG